MNNKTTIIVSAAVSVLLVLGCVPDRGGKPASGQNTPVPLAGVPVEADVVEEERQRVGSRELRAELSQLPPAGKPVPKVLRSKQSVVNSPLADLSSLRMPSEPLNRENYAHFDNNPVKRVAEYPVSTFSIDVDTGAYSNVRRILNAGQLPVHDAVRVEELINYFSYDYPPPESGSVPFSVSTEVGPNPWNDRTRLLHIGIQGLDVDRHDLPAANLVFLVDVSGSMQSADKLGLLKPALTLLSRQMRDKDRISLVVYAGASGVVLEPVSGREQHKIQRALDGLTAGGRTNGAAGIRLAYQLAEDAFIEGGINRVIIATDGDFNVGTVSIEALKNLISEKRKTGIALTTLGFGSGNYNDHLMEQLADVGDGNYAYIDNLNEARKVLVEEMGSTLQTIARDVKIQIEFNPQQVAEYRLIGYENRALKREDFSNDKIDAGDIGAGHSVTAIYEIALQGDGGERIEPLRYSRRTAAVDESSELAVVRLRYKLPETDKSRLIEKVLDKSTVVARFGETSERYRFAAAVAGFGQLLRGGDYVEDMDFQAILKLARAARGPDDSGYRGEFIQLVNLAETLATQHARAQP